MKHNYVFKPTAELSSFVSCCCSRGGGLTRRYAAGRLPVTECVNNMSNFDYHHLLQSNLSAVFSEREPVARMRAIEIFYSTDPTFYEPVDVVRGRQAISDTIDRLLASFPPDFAFTVSGPAIGHHDRCCVQWRGGSPGQTALVSGTDVVEVENGRIKSIYVFIDPSVR